MSKYSYLNYRVWDEYKKEYSDKPFSLDQYGLLYVQDEDGYWEEAGDRYIIELSTGLEDKNGKEIRDGDIMRYDAIDYQVLWSNYYASFETKRIDSGLLNEGLTLHFLARVSRVIGNIHENPELLEN